jgi:hypothetical protein
VWIRKNGSGGAAIALILMETGERIPYEPSEEFPARNPKISRCCRLTNSRMIFAGNEGEIMIAQDPFLPEPTARQNKLSLIAVTTFVECARCGFEPLDQLSTVQRCPRCRGFSWRRLPRPGALLEVADHRDHFAIMTEDD